MGERGIWTAVIVSLAWIILQNAWMHHRPAENRFRAMALGYLTSLPFVYLVWFYLAQLPFAAGDPGARESTWMGFLHAYLFHLLIFFVYVECFYHVERSVTLRLLVELLKLGGKNTPAESVQGRYPLDGMVRDRLEILRERGFLEFRDGVWHLTGKGLLFARVTATAAWVFQARGQHEQT